LLRTLVVARRPIITVGLALACGCAAGDVGPDSSVAGGFDASVSPEPPGCPVACPSGGLQVFTLPCASAQLTSVMLTGACEAGDTSVSQVLSGGEIAIASPGPGDCHVQLTFATGFVYSADVIFAPIEQGGPSGCPPCSYVGPAQGPIQVPGAACLDGSVADGQTPASAADASVDGAVACNADNQCGGGGARCIDGACTPEAALCSDATQCGSGESCVDGVCTPKCATDQPCPIGLGCDLSLGVCSLNESVCASTADCQGGTVCVEQFCVAPCDLAEGPLCPDQELCVNGGCLPDQAASFACTNDGYTGLAANACSSGSICLHHDCYVECEIDGGAPCAAPACGIDGGAPCATPSVCKALTTQQGTFTVCGPASALGSQCDPAVGATCDAGADCVDGYCR